MLVLWWWFVFALELQIFGQFSLHGKLEKKLTMCTNKKSLQNYLHRNPVHKNVNTEWYHQTLTFEFVKSPCYLVKMSIWLYLLPSYCTYVGPTLNASLKWISRLKNCFRSCFITISSAESIFSQCQTRN